MARGHLLVGGMGSRRHDKWRDRAGGMSGRLLRGQDERRAKHHPAARRPGETRQHWKALQPIWQAETSSTGWMPAGAT